MEYVKYTVDGKTVYLENINGVWTKSMNAPNEPGIYNLELEASNGTNTTFIDSTDPRYNFKLNVLGEYKTNINLLKYLPEEIANIKEFEIIMDIESPYISRLYEDIDKFADNILLDTMPIDKVKRFEDFLGIIGEGTLEQRKSYIKALIKKGNKLSENSIKTVIKTITGSNAIIKFYSGNEGDAPIPGQGTLNVQVLSPDPNINYKFDDIIRVIEPLMPAHIKLLLMKYFSTWRDIINAYGSWNDIKENATSWEVVRNYIPPNEGG